MPATKRKRKSPKVPMPGKRGQRGVERAARLQQVLNDEYVNALLRMDLPCVLEMMTDLARDGDWPTVAEHARSVIVIAEYLRDFDDE